MHFELVPFQTCPIVESLVGNFLLRGDVIDCQWRLRGSLDKILWPEPDGAPARRVGLWEHTCFEFFIGARNAKNYDEFNLSPAGHWNAFAFSDVRSDMRTSEALRCRRATLTPVRGCEVTLSATVAFRPAGVARRFRVGIASVIEGVDGSMHYFALAHPGDRPDFHAPAIRLLEVGDDG